MSNTVFENTVLEAKLTELMDSKLRVRGLMSVDDSLTQSAGLTKTINRYTYNGTVETLGEGEANSSVGEVTFTPEEYTVKRYQQTFRYSDIEAMKDPALRESVFVLPEEEAQQFMAFNVRFHTEERLPESAVFTDAVVEDFTCRAVRAFRLFLEQFFPELRGGIIL